MSVWRQLLRGLRALVNPRAADQDRQAQGPYRRHQVQGGVVVVFGSLVSVIVSHPTGILAEKF